MAIRKFLDWRHWFRGIWTAIIQGGCSGVLGTLGIAGANAAGVDVKTLDFKQMGAVFLGAAIVSLALFLRTNPFPNEVEESTLTLPPFPPAS